MALQSRHALLCGVDPEFASHSGQRLHFQVRRAESQIGPEVKLLHRPRRALARTRVFVEECLGQHAQQLENDSGVRFLALFAVPLPARVAEERIQPRLFLLLVGLA